MNTKYLKSLLALLLIFVLASCNNDKTIKPKQSDQNELIELTIGYPHLRIALPVIVAYDQGFFKSEGLDVDLKSYSTAQPMMDAIISGKINLGGFCALPITFGAMAKSNQKVLFVGGMFENEEFPISELIVKDTAVIKSISDLNDKRVGILPTRAYEVWMQDILSSNNVKLENVTISFIKPPLQADALNNGTVDALFTNDPAASTVKSKGIGISLGNGWVPNTTNINPFYFGSFNIREDYAKANPDIVLKVSKALDKAIDFIDKNQGKAKDILAKTDNKTTKPYLPKAYHSIVSSFPNSRFRRTNSVKQNELDELKKYYLARGILPKQIELNELQFNY